MILNKQTLGISLIFVTAEQNILLSQLYRFYLHPLFTFLISLVHLFVHDFNWKNRKIIRSFQYRWIPFPRPATILMHHFVSCFKTECATRILFTKTKSSMQTMQPNYMLILHWFYFSLIFCANYLNFFGKDMQAKNMLSWPSIIGFWKTFLVMNEHNLLSKL